MSDTSNMTIDAQAAPTPPAELTESLTLQEGDSPTDRATKLRLQGTLDNMQTDCAIKLSNAASRMPRSIEAVS